MSNTLTLFGKILDIEDKISQKNNNNYYIINFFDKNLNKNVNIFIFDEYWKSEKIIKYLKSIFNKYYFYITVKKWNENYILEKIDKKTLIDEYEDNKIINKENKINEDPLLNFKVSTILNENIDYIFEHKNKKTLGNPTGISNLDEVIDGIFGLVGLTGVPGSGKTSLGLQIANHNVELNNPVIYISLEISAKLLLMKWASFLSETYLKNNLKKFLYYEEAFKFYNSLDKLLSKENLFIIDKSHNPSFELIENIINEVKKKYPKKDILVVLDYLNIFNEPSLKNIKDKNEKMATVIQELIDIKNKTLANFLIILAKNKQGYKLAEMSSIKGDNNLEYGLETIISLEDPKNVDIKENTDILDFNLVAVIFKNRWGENFRKIPLKFEGKINKFFEVNINV